MSRRHYVETHQTPTFRAGFYYAETQVFLFFPIQFNWNIISQEFKLPPILLLQLPKGATDRRTSQEQYVRLVQYAKRIPIDQLQSRGKEAYTALLTSCAIVLTYVTLASTLVDAEKYRNKSIFMFSFRYSASFFLYSDVLFAILLHCL